MNQTLRRPDSGSAAMSIIGQEREGRERIREKSATWTEGGGGRHLPPEGFVARGGAEVLTPRHDLEGQDGAPGTWGLGQDGCPAQGHLWCGGHLQSWGRCPVLVAE